ncbi:hypothetical protein [uncultured Nostoc sp.]|uniref:hypothetical protein n=1 Tax=uncultured Nostoc sp. TaxID=340711 RepID=UPI0035CAECBF
MHLPQIAIAPPPVSDRNQNTAAIAIKIIQTPGFIRGLSAFFLPLLPTPLPIQPNSQ